MKVRDNPVGGDVRVSGDSAIGQTVARAFDGMWASARCGKPVRADDYLDLSDPASSDADFVLDLVYAEYLVRCETEGPPPVSEFTSRFPHIAERIRRQFELHNALDSCSSTLDQSPTAGDDRPLTIPLADPPSIGRYRVINRLGAGAQGNVYRGFHPDLGRDVVIKLSHRTALVGEFDLLRSEARLLASLDHPNLARVYDLDTHASRPFMVMEYVQGRPVDLAASGAGLAPERAAELVAKAARAVAHANGRGVVHRDLKPENVLIDDTGGVRVIDFGLAKLLAPGGLIDASDGSLAGTVRYMSPEQARGEIGAVGPRTDVFGLGAVLYFLLTGSPLYPGASITNILDRACRADWDHGKLMSPAIPVKLRAVCEKALAANPADRYPSADALAAALGRAAAGRRGHLFALSIATLLIGGLIAGGWSAIRPTPGTDAALPELSSVPPQTEVQVRVWDDNQERYRDLAPMLPLHTGQKLRYQTVAAPGHHLALFEVDATGKVRVLTSTSPRSDGGAITYPPDPREGSPLAFPDGTVAILLCGRSGSAVTAEEVQAAVGSDRWPILPKDSVVLVERGKVSVAGTSRALGPPTAQPDPEGEVLRRLDAARVRLAQTCDILAGIAFSHR